MRELIPLCTKEDEVIGKIDKVVLHQFVKSGSIVFTEMKSQVQGNKIILIKDGLEIGIVKKNHFGSILVPYHRSVQVFIVNPKLEVLVHQTSSLKGKKAGQWTVSASGHVSADESYEIAAIREVFEEVGIRIKNKDLIFLTKVNANKYTGWEHAIAYYVITDANTSRNEETADWFFAPIDEVKKAIDNKSFLTKYRVKISPVFQFLFKDLWEKLK
jgi:isopentenyldiphosphate isomerase